MRGLLALALALVAASSNAAEFDLSVHPPSTGFDLLRALQREEQSVKNSRGVQALTDTVFAKGLIYGMASTLTDPGMGATCVPVFSNDVVLAVRAYLEQHTAALSGPPYPLVKQALIDAYPCAKKGGAEAPPQVTPIR